MKYLSCFLLFIYFNTSAQTSPGARFTSMAGGGIALQDIWSLNLNQAGLAAVKKPQLAIGYEQVFSGQKISTQSALLVIPHGKNAFGLNFQRYGVAAYSQLKAGFTWARNFGDRLLLGLNLNYHQLSINTYGSASAFSVETGIQYRFTEQVWLGAHISNPAKADFGKELETVVPVNVGCGVAYQISDKVLISADAVKTLKLNTDVKLGLEYAALKNVSFRGGISANPFKQYAGFGTKFGRLGLDAAVSSHPVLGYSPQIALGYEF